MAAEPEAESGAATSAPGRMPWPVLGALAGGAAILVWLIARVGVAPVLAAAGRLGWGGFLFIVVCHLGLIVLMGHAWWLLAPHRPPRRAFVFARFVRDSAAEALPLSQVGGFVVGARALVLGGASGRFAAASTLVDLTVEACAKLPYTLLGVALLWLREPGGAALIGGLGVLVVALPALCVVLFQRQVAGLVERGVAAIARRTGGIWSLPPASLRQEIATIYRRRLALAGAFAIHATTWLLSGVELWLMLRLMGAPLGLAAAIIIDSLLNGLRSFAFAIPGALGVQEAGYVMLGALFAMPPELAIALSLLRRGRDLAIGIPGVLAWQGIEGHRLRRNLLSRR